jgi:long-chain acyl-CoA synthetase
LAAQSFRSVADMFLQRVASTPNAQAFLYPEGATWKTLTWKETGDRVRAVACGLRALGLRNEVRCAILSGTRIDWIVADLGILCAAGATTTIYPSNTPEECAYILRDSNSVFVFAENDDQVAKLQKKRADLALVKNVITFDGKASDDGWVITLDKLMEKGRALEAKEPGAFEKTANEVRAESLATLIYTSGTTGQPKGVELTHDCWMYTGEAIEAVQLLTPQDKQYLWLPLAHSFGKVLEAAQLRIGFCTAVDGRIDKLVENLAVIQPSFVCGVPRIFEKVHNRVVQTAKDGGGLKFGIFQWAMGVGRRVSAIRQQGGQPSGLLAIQNAIADRLVFQTLRQRFGGKLRFFVSGSAPLSRYIAEFFHAAGLLVLEGYGLTESSASSFVNVPGKYRFGTVGPALPGTEVKTAEDGEILIKSRGVMRGYHNLPGPTREALDNGWLRTGDIGVIEDGFLKITDRKKDLIKTSGGKYVAPQALEGRLKALCPYVSQVVVHGDNRNFVTALIALDEESIRKWAREQSLGDLTYAQLAAHPKAKELIEPFVKQLNAELPSYETVKKFAILPADLTQEAGELTPSLKVKRKVVEQKYRQVLDNFYGETVAEA